MKNSFEINEYNGEVFEYKIPNTKHCIVKIPRDYLRKIDDSIYQEINTNIIYFLINKENKKIYVGKSNIRKCGSPARLFEHDNNKSWWDEVLVYPNNEMEQNISSIVESHFIKLLKNKIYTLDNKNDGGTDSSNIASTKWKSDQCIQAIEKLIKIHIYDIFWEKDEIEKINFDCENNTDIDKWYISVGNNENTQNINNEKYEFNNLNLDNNYKNYHEFYFVSKKYKATLLKVEDKKYILKKGSKISEKIWPKIPKHIYRYRKEYDSLYNKNYELISNIEFSSSSAAASFVSGSSSSGNYRWKDKDNKSPEDIKI